MSLLAIGLARSAQGLVVYGLTYENYKCDVDQLGTDYPIPGASCSHYVSTTAADEVGASHDLLECPFIFFLLV